MAYSTDDIRNLALVGHAGSGKTSLAEALLHASGTISTRGSIERGNTQSDFDPQEKAAGHSLYTTLLRMRWKDSEIQLLDTPGLADFRGKSLTALEAVETCAVVVNAQNGIEFSTRRMMDRAQRRGVCRMLIVNQIDADGVDLESLVADLQQTFGRECLPLNLPSGGEVVDCFFQQDGTADFDSVAEAHQRIIDQVVEINETTMEHFLEGGEEQLSGQELHDAFEQCMREGHLVPICFVSAKTGAGVEQLLDLISRLLPNPREGNPPPFQKGDGPSAPFVRVNHDPEAHVVAHVFKIISDPFLGKIGLFRIWQGSITRDTQLFIGHGRKPFKVGHLFRLQGKDHIEIERGIPGDFCAVAKIDEIHHDAVLHDSHDEDHWHLKPIDFPEPMSGLAIEPATRGQEQKLSLALSRLCEEDPCFRVEHHAELNETVIRGLGEIHLRTMLERMRERYGVEVISRPPRIAYRETIGSTAEGHYRHKKQTGGAGQFGEVFLRVAPLERGAGFQFVNAVVGGAIPHSLIPAAEKGIRQALQGGAIAGYPIHDVQVTVYDGKYHPVDSKEVAFVVAGRKAFLDAVSKARPAVLEPMVNLEVTVPDSAVGNVTGGLAVKRARISGTDVMRGGYTIIRAVAPLAELQDYATEIKAVTSAQGSFHLELSHYEPVPGTIQKQLIEAYKPHEHED